MNAMYTKYVLLGLALIGALGFLRAMEPVGISPKEQKQLNLELHGAAMRGHTKTVQALIAKGADINAQDLLGGRPLHRAAMNGHTETVQALINKGADINAQDKDGTTPLHWAAINGHTAIAQALIIKGADINAQDKVGRTPLHGAAGRGHTDAAQALIDKGADINAQDKVGRTPLHGAAREGHTETVQALIAKGADITIKATQGSAKGKTPFQEAGNRGIKQAIINHVTAIQPDEIRGILQFLIELRRRGLQKDIYSKLRKEAVQDLINAKLARAKAAAPGYDEAELRRMIETNVGEAWKTTPIKSEEYPETIELEDPL